MTKKTSRTAIEDIYTGGTRTNVTFLTGEEKNGKTEWLYGMLNERKRGYLEGRFKKIQKRFLKEQKEKMTEAIGTTEFSKEDEEALLEFIDTDTEWADLTNFVEKHPDSEMGYGCHVISLKDIENEAYPNGYKTERQRAKVIQSLVKKIWVSICPEPEPYEVGVFDDKGKFTGEFEIHEIPSLPKNLFVDGSLTAKEIKQIISELKAKARSHFIMCHYTGFVFDEPGNVTKKKNYPVFSQPDKSCLLNALCILNKNGIVSRETYNELDIL